MFVKDKPILWWAKKWVHARFILRELTSVPVAFYAVILILQIRAMGLGPEAYTNFTDWLKTPLSLTLHVVSLFFVIYHSITWFNLAPKAIVIRIGKIRIPGLLIVGLNLAAWVVFSVAITWLFLNLDNL
jgi:fumarate reductase subunit C